MAKNYFKDIKEIREELDKIKQSNNYAKSLADKELDNFTYLGPEDTNIPFRLWVDSNMEYQKHNHLLCAYVLISEQDILPVIIGPEPYVIGEPLRDISELLEFISKNYIALEAYANRKIDSADLYDAIDDSFNANNSKLVVEMGTIAPEKTGVPIYVWVDDSQHFLRCGHSLSYRMKFQQDKDVTDTDYWIPITLPDITVRWEGHYPTCKEPIWKVNKVIKWAKLNLESLMLLKDALITGKQFKKEYMKKLGGVELLLTNSIPPSYAKISEKLFGYYICRTDDNKYNLLMTRGTDKYRIMV